MKRKSAYALILYIVLFLMCFSFCTAGNKHKGLQSNDVDPSFHSIIFSNEISYWVWANCISGRSPKGGCGFYYYPFGFQKYKEPLSGFPLVYTDGILWGGMVHDGKSPKLRVSGSVYFSGLQPGAIQNGTSVQPSVNRNIWTTLKSDYTFSARNLMAQLIYDKSEEEVWDRYELTDPFIIRSFDKDSWPWQFGAPYGDLNENKIFGKGEIAGMEGAGETIWTVCNDLDSNLCDLEFKCPSTGMEIQETAWIYNSGFDLSVYNTFFKRYRFIYKGRTDTPDSAHIDSMYITVFCDPNIGNYANDCAGCDTSLNLMFAYNADPSEPIFEKYNYAPMSIGYDLVRGPVIKTNNPADNAIFCGRKISGYKNLGMTAFNFMENDPLSDPGPHWPYSDTWYKYMQGINFLTNSPFKTAAGNSTKFPFSGDPVTQSGDLDTYFNTGGSDRRIMLNTGPFSMALGDTQEVIIAITAGTGPDYLQSISYLKYVANTALEIAKNNFQLFQKPPAPEVTGYSVNDRIVITWDSAKKNIENWQKEGYVFEGYNVYYKTQEYPYKERMATFDLKNGISVISQKYYDWETGIISQKVVQYGTDSGLQYYYSLEYIKGEYKRHYFVQGKTYTFGISSYARSLDPGKLLSSVESPITWENVQFQPVPIGTRVQNNFGDTLKVSHISGNGPGKVSVNVIDPMALTGNEYSLKFHRYRDGHLYWSLKNLFSGKIFLPHQTNWSGDLNYLITEGFQVVVAGPPAVEAVIQVADSNGNLTSEQFDEKGEKYQGNWVLNDLPAGQETYYFSFINEGTPQWEESIQNANYHDFEIRFNDYENPIVDWKSDLSLAQVPFEIWDIGINSCNNQSDDIQCIASGKITHTETGEPFFGFTFHDPVDYLPSTEAIEVLRPENQNIYNDFVQDIDDGVIDSKEWLEKSTPVLSNLILVNEQREFPPPGTIIRILLNKPFSTEDEFRFSTSHPLYSIETARKDAEKITVVPNPYYGEYQRSVTWEQTAEAEPQYVTFHHLPHHAIIHIFDLAGNPVITLEKSEESQYLTWNLVNRDGMLVANGLYIIYINLPELGTSKILKLSVCHY